MNNLSLVSLEELSTSLQHFGAFDYTIFAFMLAICVVIGIYFGFIEHKEVKNQGLKERVDSTEELDYLVGGRKMKVIPISMSLVASWVSGISLLGLPTEIYIYGTQFCFVLIGHAISTVICWYVFLPVFHNLNLTSSYEYLRLRFDRRVQLFGSILYTLGTMLWLPIVIFMPALAFNQVTGINIHLVTPIVCIVCIFYTCVGGLKAVVWTDVIQTCIMFGAIVIVIVKGTIEVGGFDVVWNRNYDSGRIEFPSLSFDPTVRHTIWGVMIGNGIHHIYSAFLGQSMIQRFLAVPTLKDARKCLLLYTAGLTVLLGSCMYTGLLAYAYFYDCDPLTTKLAKAKDQVTPLLVMNILGVLPGLPGIFVAGVFSAALSSLSTGLNSLCAIVLEDFIKPFVSKPLTERQISYILRSVVVLGGAICVAMVFIVEKLGQVLQLTATLNSISMGPSLGIFLIGVCLPWINGKSALTGGFISLAFNGFLAFRAQTAIMLGSLRYEPKPVATEGCDYEFPNSTAVFPDGSQPEQIHVISYIWYTAIGTTITVIASALCSIVFGVNDPTEIEPKLLTPMIRKYFISKNNKEYNVIRQNDGNIFVETKLSE